MKFGLKFQIFLFCDSFVIKYHVSNNAQTFIYISEYFYEYSITDLFTCILGMHIKWLGPESLYNHFIVPFYEKWDSIIATDGFRHILFHKWNRKS